MRRFRLHRLEKVNIEALMSKDKWYVPRVGLMAALMAARVGVERFLS